MFQETEEITIGCDPELFIRDKTKPDFPLSAHGLVNGTKYNPEIVDKGAIQIDGTALEFNIEPAKSLTEFLNNINRVMTQLEARIKEQNPNFEFNIIPVAKYDQQYFDSIPDENKELGCSPDFNAYTGKNNLPPRDTSLYRVAGGHIHIGWTYGEDEFKAEHFHDCQTITKQLDVTLNALAPLWDKDNIRKTFYGAKGAFRPKHYGVEYRVLSNQWLKSKPLQAWVYMATMRSIELLKDGVHLYNNDAFHVAAPSWIHRILVREYEFPSLPYYKGE